jgi:long-subunit fatty acid transport protein
MCLGASVMFLSSPLQAETLIPTLEARSAGRGGANLAFNDNGYVLHDNPAGLHGAVGDCCLHPWFFQASVAGLFPDLEYSDPQNAQVDSRNDPFGLGTVTLARRLDDDWSAGVGVYTPAGFGAKWNLMGPPGPLAGPQLYKSLGMLIRVLPGIACRLTDRLQWGATLGVAVSHVELEGPHFIQSPPLRGVPNLIDIQTTGAALTWSTGIQYQATEQWTLAARYQSQNRFENQGNARISIPLLGTSFYDTTMSIVWPRQLGVGARYDATPSRRYGLDVDWQQWSRAAETIDFTFRDPNNPIFAIIAGPEVKDQIPLDWRDVISVKTGVEQDIGSSTVRMGYAYNSDAVRGATATPYLPTILSHYFTTGYGWKSGAWAYDIAYQFAFRPTMHVANSSLAGGDHSNSSMSTQTHWVFVGAQRHF